MKAIDEHFNADWKNLFDIKAALSKREKPGMPAPSKSPRKSPFGMKKCSF
jgi:hypothetical protein